MRFSALLFGVSLVCAVAAVPSNLTDVVGRQEGDGAIDEVYHYDERQEGDGALDEQYEYEERSEESEHVARSNLNVTAFGRDEDPLEALAKRTSCTAPEGAGSCMATSSCKTTGFNVAGHCPGSASIQCCIKKTCSTPSGSGLCLNTSDGCSGGSFISGYCPGSSGIKCCVKGASSGGGGGGGGGGSSSSSRGQSVVNAAKAEEGIPYVFGGGGCAGKSNGGFDCSGLTQYAHCHALNKKIPRTAATQYASSLGKRIPRAQAQAGDLLFWATGGKCSGSSVEHVGIFMRKGWMVNAAHTGTPVREQAIWTSSGGLKICPYVMRFW